jgi:hypothetical protein
MDSITAWLATHDRHLIRRAVEGPHCDSLLQTGAEAVELIWRDH